MKKTIRSNSLSSLSLTFMYKHGLHFSSTNPELCVQYFTVVALREGYSWMEIVDFVDRWFGETEIAMDRSEIEAGVLYSYRDEISDCYEQSLTKLSEANHEVL